MAEQTSHVVLIAGPNGSGKSTVAPALIRDYFHIAEYVNADVIAQGLSGFNAETVAVEAGRIMLHRMRHLAAQKKDFALETTLASRTFASWLPRLHAEGYQSHLVFLWLPSVEFALARVALRVQQGGHAVSPEVVSRRYWRRIENLMHLYRPQVNMWRVYNAAADDGPQLVASGAGGEISITAPHIWSTIQEAVSR